MCIIIHVQISRKLKQRYGYSFILLKEFVRTDFKLRYEGSALGYLWSILKPLALFVVLYLVFGVFLAVSRGVPNFPVYLILGIVLWNFFLEVTKGSVTSIVSRTSLIRKISFPRYVIVLATTFSALINLGINFIIVGIFMYFSHISLTLNSLLIIFLVIELFVLAVGVGLILSALYVRYRDVDFIWDVLMQATFYAIPIIYPVSLIPHSAQKVLMLNPLAQIIQDARAALISPDTITVGDVYSGHGIISLVPVMATIVIFIVGVALFKRRSPHFAEEA